jgi:hypothetical protein
MRRPSERSSWDGVVLHRLPRSVVRCRSGDPGVMNNITQAIQPHKAKAQLTPFAVKQIFYGNADKLIGASIRVDRLGVHGLRISVYDKDGMLLSHMQEVMVLPGDSLTVWNVGQLFSFTLAE